MGGLSLDDVAFELYSMRYEFCNRNQRRHISKRYRSLDKG